MGQVRHGSATTTYAVRAAIMRAGPPPVRGQARMIASFARAAEPRARHQPQDRREVAQARDGRGHEDRAEGTAVNGADRGGRIGGGGVPSPYAVAAGRLSLCTAALNPALDAFSAAPVSAAMSHDAPPVQAPWRMHLAPAGCGGRQAQAAEVQALPHRRSARSLEPMALGASLHIDIAEVQKAEGKLFLFVGIDRTAKFAVAQLVATADRKTAWEFLQHMLEAVPYQVHTILTDNGIQFAEQPRNRNTIHSRPMRFDMICEANGIEHRLTKPNHPWSSEDQKTVRWTVFPKGRPGRADEPHDQGSNRQAVPLRQP